MPNWCECDLWVYGPASELRKFREEVRGEEELDADRILPYPLEFWKDDYNADKLERLFGFSPIESGYSRGGYHWCLKNWGTKWPPSNVCVVQRKRSLFYTLNSPWSPPIPLVLAASRKFPRLRFVMRYYEHGVGFQGRFVAKAGRVLEDRCWGYRGDRGG
jgi:hypothetical protein